MIDIPNPREVLLSDKLQLIFDLFYDNVKKLNLNVTQNAVKKYV
tara:strand:+ start:439 stop:570 length:132 start_codon:yes stop_codon:yes gene_type:complete